MGTITIRTEEHHRRPTSLGGTNSPSNISYVVPKLHKHWHILFGNMNAHQICNQINVDWKNDRDGVTVVCKFINGTQVKGHGENLSKNENKRKKAWKGLSMGLSSKEEIISFFNSIWIDASYHFYLQKN